MHGSKFGNFEFDPTLLQVQIVYTLEFTLKSSFFRKESPIPTAAHLLRSIKLSRKASPLRGGNLNVCLTPSKNGVNENLTKSQLTAQTHHNG